MIFHAEGIGHSPLALYAVLKRNPLQIALPVVSPGMVDATEILFSFAVGVETDESATMRAPILECIYLAIIVPGDDDRSVADLRGAKIAGLRQFDLKRQ